jgi:HEXXH motif-containing protein
MNDRPTVFAERLDDGRAEKIALRLRQRRLAFASDALARALRGECKRDAAFDAWVRGMAALLGDDPVAGRSLLEHWSVESLLSRVSSEERSRCFAGDLACGLLHVRLRSGAPILRGSFDVTVDEAGCVPCYPADGRYLLDGASGSRRSTLQATAAREFIPFERSRAWSMPIVPDDSSSPAPFSPRENASATTPQGPPRLADSLDEARTILDALWPETVAWIALLVPAVVELAAVPGCSLSGSTVPGQPVYLSAVHDPFELAENLVHEQQHLRLGLHAVHDYATRWADGGELFISPYRPDPRPLRGIHLGLHAFLAVNELRLRAARAAHCGRAGKALRDAARTHRLNQFAYETLTRFERFTAEGRAYWDEVGAAVAAQGEALREAGDASAQSAADDWLSQHLERVRAVAPDLPNDDPVLISPSSSWRSHAVHAN